MTERIKGAAYLADYPAPKLIMSCELCGWRVQYDKRAMLDAGGDRSLPDLIREVAGRNQCKQPMVDRMDAWKHCKARYENAVSGYQAAKGR